MAIMKMIEITLVSILIALITASLISHAIEGNTVIEPELRYAIFKSIAIYSAINVAILLIINENVKDCKKDG